ncbi:hypothetical protein OBBRIDRAFT_795572 [Obba rivulosa]|uniref:Uncharacterized protein n=1 Tax=Obba rivulosa TaxID=1052685 RepID=A0A8E2AWT6_9APHY|nr:hypothetical protein OBBRIDRAFT_795572 [Obba rivulosa]
MLKSARRYSCLRREDRYAQEGLKVTSRRPSGLHGLRHHNACRRMDSDLCNPMSPDQNHDFGGNARHFGRIRRPARYYLIDFGPSRKYEADDLSPDELPIVCGDNLSQNTKATSTTKRPIYSLLMCIVWEI